MLEEQLKEHRVLKTKRLLLRSVTMADAEAMFAYTSDTENTNGISQLIVLLKKLKR
ncbi:hypothetical protein DJZ09_00549 [Streptococcus infantarius subsp. infantarius]|nr:hypothetical protein [Streptococcus infantarius subsp. infantarius]MCO4647194.1 hypothetical protein [Streptococcus infantarius subsp. infantarius]MCO4662568.1 hypothetical protein [Streptococcus infantarius subsp. infantarius]